MGKTRRSNIELLRIVSMLMVLAVHIDGSSVGLPQPCGLATFRSAADVWRLAVESLCIVGVNCFTLISGYFGIRLRWRTMLLWLAQCAFYSVAIYLIATQYGIRAFSASGLLDSFMVLTHTDLWYVPAYFLLCLLAPLLNAAAEALPRRTLRNLIVLFAVYTVWGGWLWDGKFNPTGYTVFQLMLMYMAARYIGLYHSPDGRSLWAGRHAGILAVLSFSAVFISAMWLQLHKAFAYNSPAVLCASLSLFLVFLRMDFRSRAVNYVAGSAFAVYLIHKHPLLWGNKFRPFVIQLWGEMSLWQFTLAAVALMVATYLTAMAAEILRRNLFACVGYMAYVVRESVRRG